jgi:hypothetical protein
VPLATRFRSNSPPVIQETIDGETIMVNLDTGSYYWLDPLASYIAGAIQSGAAVDELVAELTQRFPDDAAAVEREVQGLMARLVEEQLVVPSNGSVEADGPRSELPDVPRFEAPVFKCYTDMQELLLLDPVHEVGAGGWPEPR